ncbi:MAG: carbon-nitrogen hydrolase family protein [Pirellulales bacterium]
MKSLAVATCQFSVEARIDHNRRWVLRQIDEAARAGADVVHFSECALSGYAGVDIPDIAALDWDALRQATRDVLAAARRRRVWVLLGSTHYLDEQHKPHNCVYVIDARGEIVDRYDKRFCTGVCGPQTTLDLIHYSPGDRYVTFRVKGFVGGVAICYDYRFPELYRGYKQRGVDVIFQSFHNARKSVVADPRYNIWKTIVPATMMCRAAENHFWVSANNSTARPSKWGSFTVRPDGAVTGRLAVHRPGVLLTSVVRDKTLMDAPGPWRESAMNGVLHSGQLVDHPRSRDVQCL